TNFEHALETVDTFCTHVSEEQLLDEPGMQPLRRRLLELALQYYQRFQREQSSDPNVMSKQGDDLKLTEELARSFLRSGIIPGELGDTTEAWKELLRAKDILEALCRAQPKDVKLKVQLALCYIEVERAQSYFESSVTSFDWYIPRSSVALMKELV